MVKRKEDKLRHFRLLEERYDGILYPYGGCSANVTLCKIDLDKKKGILTTRDWKEVTCPECKRISKECDKVGQAFLVSLKGKGGKGG